ncbi:34780_t:CDS:1, partial [Racocetra persica]
TYTDGNQKYLLANFTKSNFWELENPRTHLYQIISSLKLNNV